LHAMDFAQQRQPVHARHGDVRENDIELPLLDLLQSRRRIGGGLDAVPETFDIGGQVIANVLFVVNDQYGCPLVPAPLRVMCPSGASMPAPASLQVGAISTECLS